MNRSRFFSFIILVMLFFIPTMALSFNQSDLAGHWYGVGVVSGDAGTGDEEPRWEHFDLNINTAGQVSGTGSDPGGTDTIDPFTLLLSQTGVITDPSNPSGHGVLSGETNFFAFTDTNDGFTLYLGVKRERITAFDIAELEGDWRGCQVVTGDSGSGDDPRYGYGNVTFNDSGIITSGTWNSFSSGTTTIEPVSGVTFTMDTDGIISQTGDPTFYGILSDDANIITFVDTDSGYELFLLMRDNGLIDFTLRDVQGTWTTHAVVSGDRPVDEPAWVHSVLAFDDSGFYFGTGTDPAGSSPTSGTVELSFDGIVTVSGETVYGFLSNDRDLFVVVNHHDGNELTIGIRGGAAQVAGGMIINPGFETGDLFGWKEVVTGANWLGVLSGSGTTTTLPYSPIDNFPAPPEGRYAAVKDSFSPGASILYQDFDVPTGYDSISLSATIYVENLKSDYFDGPGFDFSGVTNQKVRLDLMDPNSGVIDVGAGVLENLFITLPGDPLSIPPTVVSVDLTPYAGQTVRLRFGAVDNRGVMPTGLDNIKLTATAPPGSLVNPGFEIGDLFGWTALDQGGGWLGVMSGTTSPQSNNAFIAPPEGTYAAVYDPNDPGNGILYQDFEVPTGYDSVSLSATIYVENLAGYYFDGPDFDSGVTNQKARLDLMDLTAGIDDTGNGVLSNLFMTNPGDSNSITPTVVSVDLTPYAGQTVRLRLGCVATEYVLLVGLDNIQITTVSPPGGDGGDGGGGGGGCFISSISL